MTAELDLDRLRAVATRFRRAIEQAPPSALGIGLDRFPHGACGNATPLLGTYLIDLGEKAFDYMLGERPLPDGRPGRQSHAWLQRGGIVIDITADQFPEMAHLPIIVAAAPTSFHRTFEARAEHVADFHIYDDHTVAWLAAAYSRIKSVLAAG